MEEIKEISAITAKNLQSAFQLQSPRLTHLKMPLMILRCVLYSDPAQKGETPPESIM